MSYKTVNGSVDEAHLVISPECYRSHAYVNSVMTRGTHYAEFTYEGSGRGVVKFGLENMPKSSVAIVHRIGQPFRSRLALYVDVDSYTMTIFQDGRVVQTVGLPRKKDSKSTRFRAQFCQEPLRPELLAVIIDDIGSFIEHLVYKIPGQLPLAEQCPLSLRFELRGVNDMDEVNKGVLGGRVDPHRDCGRDGGTWSVV
ncbi:hypothetical protein THAOC_16550, partial [Thalassiosira oceanica]